MSLLSRITRLFTGGRKASPGAGGSGKTGGKAGKGAKPGIAATYDAAQNPADNQNHWYWADALNANAANDPSTRKTLRERARYETTNNGHAGGLVAKLVKRLVGSLPRPQLRIPDAPRAAARQVERAFMDWGRRTKLGAKLRLLDRAAYVDGEGFGVLVTNRALPPEGVQLDVRLYEADQVETPFPGTAGLDPLAFSGGRLDADGNVTEWHLLKAHPGSDVWVGGNTDFDAIPGGRVLHWFTPTRPGQVRGVPEIHASLSLFAILRRYTLATLGAAETAANIAGVMETENPDDATAAPTFETMDEVELPRRGLLSLPAGYKAHAFDASQPVATYKEFKGEILTEAGQPVGAPRNISTGSSAEYNYSSGRLDLGDFQHGMRVRRGDFRDAVLDPLFRAWLDEAALVPGLLPDGLPPIAAWSWEWFFDGFTSLDPQKDAATEDTRLKNGTTTYAEVFAERGLDWEEQFEQQARERERQNDLGLSAVLALAVPSAPAPAGDGSDATDTAAAAVAGGGVQATALNGAQIASLLALADKVVLGQYPADAAEALVLACFPLMSKGLVSRFVAALAAAPHPQPAEGADAQPATAA